MAEGKRADCFAANVRKRHESPSTAAQTLTPRIESSQAGSDPARIGLEGGAEGRKLRATLLVRTALTG